MNVTTLQSLLLIAAGLFSVAGGLLNWSFFMNSSKAAFFVRVFGHTGARVFYVVLGLAIAGVGGAVASGAVSPSSLESEASPPS